MAVMNEAQQALLDQVTAAGVEYDQFEEALRQEVSDRKWEKRAKTRDLVRQARALGVPWKKLGEALNTSDHNTIKDYHDDIRRSR